MDKDVRRLCKRLRKAGLTVEHGGKHIKVKDDDGKLLAVLGTASDYRTKMNVRSTLRRAGVDVGNTW